MSSMLVVALTATIIRLPARAAPAAIASSPSGWTAFWSPTGPTMTGAETVAPSSVVSVLTVETSTRTLGRRRRRPNAASLSPAKSGPDPDRIHS